MQYFVILITSFRTLKAREDLNIIYLALIQDFYKEIEQRS